MTRCLKYSLCCFNVIFVILGLLVATFGFLLLSVSWIYDRLPQGETAFENLELLHLTSVIVIAVGFVTLIIALLGCFAAWGQKHCMLLSYASVIFIILSVQTVLMSIVINNVVKTDYNTEFSNLMSNYTFHSDYKSNTTSTAASKIIDDIQSTLKCCGAQNFTEWKPYVLSATPLDLGHIEPRAEIQEVHLGINYYPWSCCNQTDSHKSCEEEQTYRVGCGLLVEEQVYRTVVVGGIVLMVIVGIIEVLAISLAVALARKIRGRPKEGKRGSEPSYALVQAKST